MSASEARVAAPVSSPGTAEPTGAATRPPTWLSAALLVAGKDLRIEMRSREVTYTMGFLAALVVLVFSFAFVAGEDATLSPGTVSGLLWVSLLFSGTVALARTFDREREGEAMRALLLSPVPRSAIYAGKLAAVALIMFAVEIAVTALAGVLFGAAFGAHPLWLGGVLLLGCLGLAAAGVVFSGALVRARSRDALLATLLFPVSVPVLLAGARGTTLLVDPGAPDLGGAGFWTLFLAVAATVFVVVGLWIFEPVATGE